ncbi:MAG: S41 family peptidase, partial [Candidatus Omnitrophica bacterium]|nr:S41 family peptidase [Candidatus Omnitrophota bacterium]
MRKKSTVLFLVIAIAFTGVLFLHAKEDTIIEDRKGLFKQVQLLADSITLISVDYVEPVKIKDLIYGAIKGMMGTLDGYSQFLDPEQFKEITEETKGEFGGLGITIGIRDGVLTIISPMEDTPACAAGVQSGDKIVKIDDKTTQDMTLDDAVKKLRGKPGTKVTITVVREDVSEMLDFTITRAIIKIKSIKDVMVLEEGIGYVRILEFQERTAKELNKNIKGLQKKGAMGLILDVRNNPGGLLEVAVEVADLFLDKGDLIVYTEGRDPEKRVDFRARRDSQFQNMDIVVLVNRGSASGSEILAGAIKDNKRGILVGVPTFGKASVQTVIPLGDKSAIRLTTAAYYTPLGKNLMDKGVEPDIVVEKEKTARKEKIEDPDKKKTEIFEKVKEKEKADKKQKKRKKKKEK